MQRRDKIGDASVHLEVRLEAKKRPRSNTEGRLETYLVDVSITGCDVRKISKRQGNCMQDNTGNWWWLSHWGEEVCWRAL